MQKMLISAAVEVSARGFYGLVHFSCFIFSVLVIDRLMFSERWFLCKAALEQFLL